MTWNHSWLSTPFHLEILLTLISALAGLLGALLGIGGGIIIVPVLTLAFGVNIRYAIGASIVSVIATSSGAAASYVRDRITNIRVAMFLEVATTVGALTGALLAYYISPDALFLVFAIILFYSAYLMLRKAPKVHYTQKAGSSGKLAQYLRLDSSYPDPQLKQEVRYTVHRVPLGFVLMLGAGIISGLLGIGSGALKVLAMDTAMGLPIKVSSATSNFMIGVTAAASAGAYYMRGDILPILAAPVAIGVFLGSLLGARLMVRLQSNRLRGLFIVVLLLIAAEMALRGLGMTLG